jgi:hypothetical protein
MKGVLVGVGQTGGKLADAIARFDQRSSRHIVTQKFLEPILGQIETLQKMVLLD